MSKITLPSFAKINPLLRVLGRRPDGYHEIRTVLQTITLHDTITFEAHGDARLELFCDDPMLPTDERNLVRRAADAVKSEYGVRGGARIFLEKRIPTGGGLGGGSSNAAVTLLALRRLWSIPATNSELATIAATLGADVPFFLHGGTALGTGTGADITPLADLAPSAPLMLLVVTPPAHVSTAAAYASLALPQTDFLTKNEAASILTVSRETAEIEASDVSLWRNDFEPVVARSHPVTAAAREHLSRHAARRSMLSGSGASVFGVFDSVEKSHRAEIEIRRATGWQVFDCRSLTRSAYRDRVAGTPADGE